MTGKSLIQRLQRTSGRERADFAEALAALVVASAAIKLLPFRTVVRTMSLGRASEGHGPANQLTADVKQAVKRAAARLPWTIVCFPEGLAVHWMLRRRGLPSQVHYGLRQAGPDFTAHVWVSLSGAVVVGEESDDRHTCVAVFPEE
jgi:hypothetical protein